MKRFELIFTFLQLPVDYGMVVLAGVSAYALRHTELITAVRPIRFDLPWERYWPTVVLVALGWLVIFALSGLYNSDPNRKLAKDFTRIVTACSTGFAAITVYVFFTLQKFDSRFLVLAGWLLAIAYVTAGRLLLRGLKSLLHRAGVGLRRTVIIGGEAIAQTIKETLTREPRLGYQVVAAFDHFDLAAIRPIAPRIDEIIFTDPRAHEADTLSAIDLANERHITFKYSADLFSTISTNLAVSTIAGIPIIELRRTRLSGWGRIIKRTMDVVVSTILLLACAPLRLVIAMIILLETGRPVIYKNERVGQYGKKFLTLKFRTMYQKYCTGEQFGTAGNEALKLEMKLIKTNGSKLGPVYKIKADPRITPFGKFLRRWSWDELPQLWNVIKGEMSLVGPRPHQPREVAQYEKHHKILLAIKPGLSGLAQISGRSNLTFEEEARLDTFYIENWSLLMDVIILIKTPFVVLLRRGAW